MMRILCLGDVVGAPGREILARTLPAFRRDRGIDFVVGNIENVADGTGITQAAYRVLRSSGIDVCTSGDHIYKRFEVLKVLKREPERLLRPINYPEAAAGSGLTCIEAANGVKVAVINVCGRVFMDPADDPFRAVRRAMEGLPTPVVVVDMHAEATSEKRAMGWWLAGKASVVFGTHTHVPTADEEILPGGTAYITDVGMCGPYRSVIGRRYDRVLRKFTTNMHAPFDVATEDVRGCGVLVELDEKTGRAGSIERIVLR
ncbi:MAG: TIGR00282 family metallophosphoesterase [Planctomycetaceae bacterium]